MISLTTVGFGRAVSRGRSSVHRCDGTLSHGGRSFRLSSAPSRNTNSSIGRHLIAFGAADRRRSSAVAVPLFRSLVESTRTVRTLRPRGMLFGTATGNHQGAGQLSAAEKGVLPAEVREALARFRVGMMKERQPFQILGVQTITTATHICGHASFFILTLAFLETDVLALRGYAVSSIALGMMFQYYRQQPLWISIGWNGLLMLINLSMIGLLLKERRDADKLKEDPEQARIFEEVFVPVDLNHVDFFRLMELADRRSLPKGSHLFDEGAVQEDILLIVEGIVEVDSEGVSMCALGNKQFVGSMAFIRFVHNAATQVHLPSHPPSHPPSHIPSTIVDTKRTTTAPRAQVGYEEFDEEDQELIDAYDTYVPGGEGAFKKAREAAMQLRRQDTTLRNIHGALVPEVRRRSSMEGLEKSPTTAITTSDVVLYSWNMHELRDFMKSRPSASAAVQKAISVDLTHKVDQSRGQRERYRMLVTEALRGGAITLIEKDKLSIYRELHGISQDVHDEVLRRCRWDSDEFKAGYRRVGNHANGSNNFPTYEALVEVELAPGKVDDAGKRFLRQFRSQARIDPHEHLLALEKQGWTADEYEIGHKIGYAEKADIEPAADDISEEPQVKAHAGPSVDFDAKPAGARNILES